MAPAPQTRHLSARIVPAIPHRLARPLPSARPLTPEESNKGATPQQEPQLDHEHTKVENETDNNGIVEGQRPASVETPPTPSSGASTTEASNNVPIMAHSPAHSVEDGDATVVVPQEIPEKPEEIDPRCSSKTPHAESSPSSNGNIRKLHVPAELPPPFYPSAQSSSETLPKEGEKAKREVSHGHKLSAGAVEFRSANDSPAKLTTPHEYESDVNGFQQHLPRPSSSFAPPLSASFFSGHSHHPSETGINWFQPPFSLAPQDAAFDAGHDLQLSAFLNGPSAFPRLFDSHRGEAGFHSTSPTKFQIGDSKNGSDQGDESRAGPFQHSTAPSSERIEESALELAAYFSTQIFRPELADFVLQVRSHDVILLSVPVHGIVVIRSPVVAGAIRHSSMPDRRSRDFRHLIDVHATDPFVTRESLEESVKFLYGAPLLSSRQFLYGLVPYTYENNQSSPSCDAQRRMQQILSYISAARLWRLPSMQARGIEIARNELLLRWDTLELVFRYILQVSPGAFSGTHSSELNEVFTAALLNHAIDFMARSFPVDFRLFAFAPELQDAPRLPTTLDTRPPTHNPRLSKIRFGDAPPEDELQPSHAARVLSVLLLSLPLPLVNRLFNHPATANQIGWTGSVKLMRDVVSERESRRQKTVRGQPPSAQDAKIPPPLLSNMYLEESVEPSSNCPSGYNLVAKPLVSEL